MLCSIRPRGTSKFLQLGTSDSWKYKDSEGNPYKLYEYQEEET